jgi:hypothetical protein
MRQIPRIEPEKLKALKNEVDALDLLPPSLEVLDRMVKLIARHFSMAVSASYRAGGPVTYLDFKEGSPANIMNVKSSINSVLIDTTGLKQPRRRSRGTT